MTEEFAPALARALSTPTSATVEQVVAAIGSRCAFPVSAGSDAARSVLISMLRSLEMEIEPGKALHVGDSAERIAKDSTPGPSKGDDWLLAVASGLNTLSETVDGGVLGALVRDSVRRRLARIARSLLNDFIDKGHVRRL